ncbi:Aminopeptidase N [Labeo rohita]|uniref:Aminopeptidase N n=1 Tax=Labeo rohita TaxID=84645 RepID=A0ABQ8L4W3_LABRO|nr:Aminopeptidase N [Labeo rohita]
MGSHAVPDGDTINETIIQIAHKQLIQEPMYAFEIMAASAQSTLKSLLPAVSAVLALYESKIPTAKGIIALLKPSVCTVVQWHIHMVHYCRYRALTVPTLNFKEFASVLDANFLKIDLL